MAVAGNQHWLTISGVVDRKGKEVDVAVLTDLLAAESVYHQGQSVLVKVNGKITAVKICEFDKKEGSFLGKVPPFSTSLNDTDLILNFFPKSIICPCENPYPFEVVPGVLDMDGNEISALMPVGNDCLNYNIGDFVIVKINGKKHIRVIHNRSRLGKVFYVGIGVPGELFSGSEDAVIVDREDIIGPCANPNGVKKKKGFSLSKFFTFFSRGVGSA